MSITDVKPIQLTPEEATLREQMEAEFARETGYTGKAAHKLFKLLQSRRAIPQVRIDDFTKAFIGGYGKSHCDIFVESGCSGDAIFEHRHFVPFLRYFIQGPALPADTIEGFRKILVEDAGTAGMVMNQLCRFVRAETRRLHLSQGIAREEFWRLAKEVGYEHAGTIYDAARSAGT